MGSETVVNTEARRNIEGVAYGRPPQFSNEALTLVGPGTPGGEYLRRYWHPVGLSSETTSRPKKIRVLGEDLILFRDRAGRPGLLYPRCMHRGTTLYYGRVEERGIRCCYHGWLFDVEGNCLEQPCEPDGGANRANARQPWYPVEERYGLVFAYLGPPDRIPLLPKYDILEDLKPGAQVYAVGGGALAYADPEVEIDPGADVEAVPYNWLQQFENVMDPYHVWVLHSNFSTVQFAEGFRVMPTVTFEDHPRGVVYHAIRELENKQSLIRTTIAMLPCAASIPTIDLDEGPSDIVFWTLPVDDTHFMAFFAQARVGPPPPISIPLTPDGRTWSKMTEQEHQDFPGDFEAQSGQGPITLHSEEHLVKSDAGVGMLRRKMLKQIEIVQAGGNPAGTAFTPGEEWVRVNAGNYYKSIT